ncbi:MAG: hypothetical protein LRY35_04020 [Clostridiales bacterium]|nr:hypothetical protein [Clostridiales bacterium]
MLKRMNRRYTTSQFRSVAQSLREAFPAASLTTDVIVGFPGETDAEFAETLQFCQEIGFARMHVFRYSPRQGTQAANMSGQIPAAVSAGRSRTLQDLAEHMADAFHHSQLGQLQSVLVETVTDQGQLKAIPLPMSRCGSSLRKASSRASLSRSGLFVQTGNSSTARMQTLPDHVKIKRLPRLGHWPFFG